MKRTTPFSKAAIRNACIAGASAALTLAAPAYAGSEYEHEIDRFTGTTTVSFQQKQGCRQTKGIKGHVRTCLVINSTESDLYPRISFMKTNNGWELLGFGRSKTVPVIVTFKSGQVKRMQLQSKLSTSVLYGGTVAEWVDLAIKPIANQLDKIKSIETQYGSAEFIWEPDQRAACMAKLSETCTYTR